MAFPTDSPCRQAQHRDSHECRERAYDRNPMLLNGRYRHANGPPDWLLVARLRTMRRVKGWRLTSRVLFAF
jgi:hypothetical protein